MLPASISTSLQLVSNHSRPADSSQRALYFSCTYSGISAISGGVVIKSRDAVTRQKGPNRVEIVSDSQIRGTRCQRVPRGKLRDNSSLREGSILVVSPSSAIAVAT